MYIDKTLVLPARQTAILKNIEFEVSVLKVGTEIIDILLNSAELKNMLSVNGYIVADGLRFPINNTIQL